MLLINVYLQLHSINAKLWCFSRLGKTSCVSTCCAMNYYIHVQLHVIVMALVSPYIRLAASFRARLVYFPLSLE
mgnify:CR=1 FL=1